MSTGVEWGLFNDEGLVEDQFTSAEEAWREIADNYRHDEGLKVMEMCPFHGGEPTHGCKECVR